MFRFRFGATAVNLALAAFALHYSPAAWAGYFEINANGSFYRYDNGSSNGHPNTTTVKQWGAGIAYKFLENTSIELSYANSANINDAAYIDSNSDETIYARQTDKYQNVALSLILDFADKNSAFRPFIRGGAGYQIRQQSVSGTAVNNLTDTSRVVSFQNSPQTGSALAQGGLGFKIYVSNSTAIEFSALASGSDLDKPHILLNYQVTGGLRFLFQ